MKALRLLIPAESEMLGAARYYESQAQGLGQDFLEKIESAFHDIGEHPERFPVIRSDIRRRLVHRFPYAIFYRVEPEEIIVLAIAHLRRHPNYWLNRI